MQRKPESATARNIEDKGVDVWMIDDPWRTGSELETRVDKMNNFMKKFKVDPECDVIGTPTPPKASSSSPTLSPEDFAKAVGKETVKPITAEEFRKSVEEAESCEVVDAADDVVQPNEIPVGEAFATATRVLSGMQRRI